MVERCEVLKAWSSRCCSASLAILPMVHYLHFHQHLLKRDIQCIRHCNIENTTWCTTFTEAWHSMHPPLQHESTTTLTETWHSMHPPLQHESATTFTETWHSRHPPLQIESTTATCIRHCNMKTTTPALLHNQS
jgi:hypothetical protein